MVRSARPIRFAVLAAAGIGSVALMTPAPAAAQSAIGQQLGQPVGGVPKDLPGKPGLPPALPGARTATATPADPSKNPSDLQPNDALFDAINRGDMTDVKDAMSRGADLNAANVLGMKPIELAVDIGRYQIMFYLLTQRAASRPNAPANPIVTAAARKPGKSTGPVLTETTHRPAPKHLAAAPPPKPLRYVSTDPGTPVPQAGFLGFGGGYAPVTR